MRGWQIIAAVAAVLTALGVCVIFHGCANMKDPTCSLIEQGIAAIDKELEKGDSGDDDVAEAYRQSVDPVIRAKGLDSVIGMAQEYWDSLSTEQKLQAGRAVLVFLDGQYCDGAWGCSGTPSKDKIEATIAGIIRAYAGPVLPGQRRPYEAGKWDRNGSGRRGRVER